MKLVYEDNHSRNVEVKEAIKFSSRIVELAKDIAQVAMDNNKEYFIGGGLAIDKPRWCLLRFASAY